MQQAHDLMCGACEVPARTVRLVAGRRLVYCPICGRQGDLRTASERAQAHRNRSEVIEALTRAMRNSFGVEMVQQPRDGRTVAVPKFVQPPSR